MAVPAHTPVEIVPTDVRDEVVTLEPNTVELNIEVVLILKTLPLDIFVSPDTSSAYAGAETLLIPTLEFVVSTLITGVPPKFCNWIPVVELAPGLIATAAEDVCNGEDKAVPEKTLGTVNMLLAASNKKFASAPYVEYAPFVTVFDKIG